MLRYILIYIVVNIFMKKGSAPAPSSANQPANRAPKFDAKQYERPGLSSD